jgi:hypothetical protein
LSTFENVSDIGACLGLSLGPAAKAGVRSIEVTEPQFLFQLKKGELLKVERGRLVLTPAGKKGAERVRDL